MVLSGFMPLESRNSQEVVAEEGSFFKAFSIISPVLLYYFCNGIVFTLGVRVIDFYSAAYTGMAESFSHYSVLWSAAINFLAILVGVMAVFPMLKREKIVWNPPGAKSGWIGIGLMTGTSISIFVNFLFNFIGNIGRNAEYGEVAERQFALPLVAGILFYGMITPLAEEIVFRGVIYNRLRRNYGLTAALILNPLIFGLYHGNLVQAIYGAIMGFVLCWIYERFGGLLYPYLLHMGANSIVYFIVSVGLMDNPLSAAILFPISLLMSVICCIWLYKAKNHRESR